MKHRLLLFFGLLVLVAASSICHAQYSISGYLDTPDKNKRVYLSLLKYDEENTIASYQILTSTLADSLGYFSFEGKLLSEKHGLYRIHSRVKEGETALQMAFNEDIKNLHNFIFSNRDTIVFKKNKKYWFSTNTNTNPIDKEWQKFSTYATQLNLELASIRDFETKSQSSTQVLSELKSYADSKKPHPLVTLILISGIQEDILKEDFKTDTEFYTTLQDSLNSYYNNTGYAKQFKELLTDLSKTETQNELESYKRISYVLGIISSILFIVVIILLIKMKRQKNKNTPQENINLTNQEERIAELIIQDKTNKEIASELFVSLSTVKTHIRNIYAKLEVSNRQEFADKLKNHPRD